jgi:hypothetical protein
VIPVAVYSSRAEAELARALLEQAGIPAVIEADDAGGMYPSMATLGVRLCVSPGDVEEAEAVLADAD